MAWACRQVGCLELGWAPKAYQGTRKDSCENAVWPSILTQHEALALHTIPVPVSPGACQSRCLCLCLCLCLRLSVPVPVLVPVPVPVPVPVSPGLVTLLVRVLQECQTHAMTHLHGCLHGPGMGLCVVPI